MSRTDLTGTAARRASDDRLIAMDAAHAAFRRDLERMAAAAIPANLANFTRRASIMSGWVMFKGQLHIHHNAEDRYMWPRLRKHLAGDTTVAATLDAIEAEHALIDPLVAAVDAALATPDGAGVGGIIDQLRTTLSQHMSHEEREAMPLVAEVLPEKEWREVLAELHKFITSLGTLSTADFVPWLTEGTSDAQADRIATILPKPLRPVYRRVWRPRYEKASRW
jgi:iron-sulfur cluster repair protein YtfE (RIC family)